MPFVIPTELLAAFRPPPEANESPASQREVFPHPHHPNKPPGVRLARPRATAFPTDPGSPERFGGSPPKSMLIGHKGASSVTASPSVDGELSMPLPANRAAHVWGQPKVLLSFFKNLLVFLLSNRTQMD